ncbi:MULTISPECIES: LacI family DNA-binding transcriptional regulator [unclassified Modicisalibacter]|uniref:LacI family DNA-binding transcriptional regulator n=1 Tax=unclassified Modicisalibacter TaxID=2679913 RepID=UPI001CCB9CE0|nr:MULTISPECIES: LacI family DNA-binding transcriptional regulator [unclassified Modicisalibacter]MBZ9556753.1 LacI family DNA-binding transcriptional regulator [Modicisalibacter sp. R2A 31.J]MBZ9574778.1 LacI family DNA-binding transcriptional regulator [Modicisalibacter sp. MOD 31.J]
MNRDVKRTLLEDVAREAGVSTASVSRVLNGAPHVSDRLRHKVEAAVDRLGYVPHGTARALASRRIGAIGALVPTLDNPVFSAMIDSLERRLKQYDYRLLIATYRYSLAEEVESLRTLIQQGIDGAVVIGHDHLPAALQLFQQHELPYFSCWHSQEDPDWPSIGFDNAAPARRLAEHLIELGHRRIAVITAPVEGNDRARARLQGFRQAIETAGLTLPDDHVVTVDYGIEEGASAFAELMRLTPRPTAILCGNDVLAFGTVFAAQRAGIAIPGQLSVTGFDDLTQSRFMQPALTTVTTPADEVGRRVADALVARILGQTTRHRQVLEARVVLRDSTAPPPHATG